MSQALELPPESLPGPHLTTDRGAVRIVIAMVTVIAAVAVAAAHRAEPIVAALLVLVVVCYGVLSTIDAAEQRLPNRITLPLAATTALAVLIGGTTRWDGGATVGALAVGVCFALVFVVLRFGMGDVKLALTVGTIAGWLGRDAIMATAYVGAGSGAAVALLLILVHRRRDVTFGFGPFLAIGSVAGMLVSGAPL